LIVIPPYYKNGNPESHARMMKTDKFSSLPEVVGEWESSVERQSVKR
jgi:hypothetical protein